ncbi:MAG: non-heme iron oxygenase ferredoxin subunit [Nocardioides sp.]|nr:non-heme iron oxygenase ferredoxin subunit [Nocardioides sp.]
MGLDQVSAAVVATDTRRIGVWENEGGLLGHYGQVVADASPSTYVEDHVMAHWVPAVALSEIPHEGAVRVELAGIALCLARSEGVVHALLDECSHGQVALSEGEVEAGLVECWLHGSCFDLATGAPTGPPATLPVPVYPIRIVDGVIEVALSAPTPPVSTS